MVSVISAGTHSLAKLTPRIKGPVEACRLCFATWLPSNGGCMRRELNQAVNEPSTHKRWASKEGNESWHGQLPVA